MARAGGEPFGKFVHVPLDDLLADDDLLAADGHGVVGELLERIDVVEVHALEVVYRGLEIARDGEIDAEEGAIAARAHERGEALGGDDVMRSGGGTDEDI